VHLVAQQCKHVIVRHLLLLLRDLLRTQVGGVFTEVLESLRLG